VAYMISDILCKADPYFLIPIAPLTGNTSRGGAAKAEYDSLPLSRAMLHPGSYLRLRDSVIDQIAATTSPELEEARQLIYRLWSRDLYKCVATKVLRRQKRPSDRLIWEKSEDEIIREILSYRGRHDVGNSCIVELNEEDLIVQKVEIHHGQKDRDPLAKMRFLEKGQLNKIAAEDYKELPEAVVIDEDEYDSHLPRTLMECSLRIYCRSKAKCDLVSHVFSLWWAEIHSEMEMTAMHKALSVTQDTDDDDSGDNLMDDGDVDRQSSLLPLCSPY
jgi:hypothetical protein